MNDTANGTPTSKSIGTRLLFVFGLLVLAFVATAAAGVVGYHWFLMPTSADGACSVFDRNQCSALSETRVEEAADIEIPVGASIVDSQASRNLEAGRQTALIRLPATETLGLGTKYINADTDEITSDVMSYLSSRGIRDIDVDPDRGSTIYLARDEAGTTWADVRIVWNG